MKDFEKLLEIASRKAKYDLSNDWYNGPETYIMALQSELEEVSEEIPKQRKCYLEDELGDVLWNYLNILLSLERESGINIDSVLNRACVKYEERISAIESGQLWKDIKAKQKERLLTEQVLESSK